MKYMIKVIFSLVCVFCFLSCDDSTSDCREDMGVELGASFFQSIYNPQKQLFETKEYSPQIWIKGLQNDSVLCDSLTKKNIFLPLHISKNETGYIFDNISSKVIDTLIVSHTQKEKLVSLECGCKMQYTIESYRVTTHGIDSVIVIDPTVNGNTDIQLEVFFKK